VARDVELTVPDLSQRTANPQRAIVLSRVLSLTTIHPLSIILELTNVPRPRAAR